MKNTASYQEEQMELEDSKEKSSKKVLVRIFKWFEKSGGTMIVFGCGLV